MEGARFASVMLNRPDLRFPFDPDFVARVQGQTLVRLTRRAKFLQAELSSGERLFMHLGMSGRFIIEGDTALSNFVHEHAANPKHHHVVFGMDNGSTITFNDPRRFGFMELVADGAPYRLDGIGPEPLGNGFSGPVLRAALKGKKSKIKTALLDQRVVAGLGNIYVCEVLHRTGISPTKKANTLSKARIASLVPAIREVLSDAIKAGGSSLKDYRQTDGELGYFQHSFKVYDREDSACASEGCEGSIKRIVQSGRSTFYCPRCQR